MNLRKYNCPNCGSVLIPKNKKFICPKCGKSYAEEINLLFTVVEVIVLLKLLDPFSMFIANKLDFISNKELFSFVIELVLALMIGYIEARNSNLFIKLGVNKLIEVNNDTGHS